MESHDILVYLSIVNKGDWNSIWADAKSRRQLDEDEVKEVVSNLKCKAVTIEDPDYPPGFLEAACPPFVLFYEGNLSLIQDLSRCICFVGSREASPYGLSVTRELAEAMAQEGYTVVSGLAKGIDIAANLAALPYGKSVAILGNGVNYYYPAEHSEYQRQIKELGLILSEYPPSVPPTSRSFPARNRLLAASSCATICCEAQERSGTLLTVAHALSINREVGAVPYRKEDHSACNSLIRDGAYLVETSRDIHDLIDVFKQRNGK